MKQAEEGDFDSFADEDDKQFYDSLKRRGYTSDSTEYVFWQDETVVANCNPFAPFFDEKEKILSQKWHVLISCLAFLDTASDEEAKDEEAKNAMEEYNIGKIKEIKFTRKFEIEFITEDDEIEPCIKIKKELGKSLTIVGEEKRKGPYKSKQMTEWVLDAYKDACKKNESKDILPRTSMVIE